MTNNMTPQIMRAVIYAMSPGIIVMIYFLGIGVLTNIILALLFAFIWETIILKIRKKRILPVIKDSSTAVTAIIFALTIPPLTPYWMILLAMFFAVILTKHIFGGLGYNIFNPAMVGFVVLLIAYPAHMTNWISMHNQPDLLDSIKIVLGINQSIQWDAISSATVLSHIKTSLSMGQDMNIITSSPIFGKIAGYGWEFIAATFAIGGLWLAYKKIINLFIPISLLGAFLTTNFIFYLIDSNIYTNPIINILSGSVIIAAFYIATDPVAQPISLRGKILYGAMIGFLIFIIRTFGAYPDGVAFSVLLMNMTTPAIDYYFKHLSFGLKK
jgi:Na+-translocating ferredoxin:NAD+ oxidoreductase subunit D